MKRAAWLRKALWIIPLVLVVLGVLGLLILRSYLSSAEAAQEVAKRLQEMLGGQVTVQSARIGLFGTSSVLGVQAYEAGEEKKPWLHIDEATADLSVVSVLRNRSPNDIQLSGARITLRFDSDGHLLTKLPTQKKAAPTELPHLHIERGELTFDQAHRTPMIIRGLNADITPQEHALTLAGIVQDPFWGDWKAHGEVDTRVGKGAIDLDADEVAVTMEKLKSIAFVPLSVWREVHVEGATPAKVRLDMDAGGDKPDVRYRVEIAPTNAHVQVPSIDLDATQARGKAIIADEIVQLDDVHGKTAGGTISTSGKLNFRDEPTRLAFKVGVQDVILHDLPRSWKVPRSIDGKLTGSADLVLIIKNGKVETAGSGEGVIRDAKWSGFTLDKPVRLALRSDGGKFRFHQPQPGAFANETGSERTAKADELLAVHRAGNLEESEEGDEGGLFHNAPTELVNLLGRGIQMAGDGVARGINNAANALSKLKPPSKPGEPPTYLDVDLSLNNVDLAQLVKKLGLSLPYPITGRLTFQVHASIPVNTAGDLKAYRLRGTAKLPSFQIDGLTLTDVETQVRYTDGVLDLQSLQGQMPGPRTAKTTGKFHGNARVQIVPSGELHASLHLEQIPLATLLSVVPQAGSHVSGSVSGMVQGRAPLEKLSDPASWRGGANLSAPQIVAYGIPLQNASVGLIVKDAKAELSMLKADLAGAPLTGNGNVKLQGDYSFDASVDMKKGDLTTLNRLSPAFRPPFELKGSTDLKGSIEGTLKPFRFDTKGSLNARNLVIERFTVDKVSFDWSKDENDLKLDHIDMALYGGSVSGTARLPLSAAAPGSANLKISDLNVQAMAKALPAFPVRLEGKISGTIKGALSAAEGDRPRSWTSNVKVKAPQLRVQGIPAEQLTGTLESRDGRTQYDLEGETLGGTFRLKGDLPPPSKEGEKKPSAEPVGQEGPQLLPVAVSALQAAAAPAGNGEFTLRNAQLARVWSAFNITGGLAHLNGSFFITLNYQLTEPDFFPVGNGTFRIENITWDNQPLGNILQGYARLTANALELTRVWGEVAGGTFLGAFSFGLKENARGWFRIELQQVEASQLLMPVPEVARHVKGAVDVNLRGRIGREWDGGGVATLARGQVYGMDITEWRVPFSFSFVPSEGNGQLAIRDSNARIAQGRARFESMMNWGNGVRLSGLLLFYQVNLRTLLQHSPSVASYVSGRLSGRVDLSGSEMRSINDLSAVVQARLEQGQALQLPVLRQLIPYLRLRSAQTSFQSGELKGRLAGGIFRVQRATLVGEFLKLLIVGTITLAGNLNLEVTAQTGLYCLNPKQTDALRSRIPILGAIPRLVLYEISSILSAAVIHLRVTGTVSSPIIRVEPILLMTEEAIRFFLGRAVGFTGPSLP